jgi:hypothetical protein
VTDLGGSAGQSVLAHFQAVYASVLEPISAAAVKESREQRTLQVTGGTISSSFVLYNLDPVHYVNESGYNMTTSCHKSFREYNMTIVCSKAYEYDVTCPASRYGGQLLVTCPLISSYPVCMEPASSKLLYLESSRCSMQGYSPLHTRCACLLSSGSNDGIDDLDITLVTTSQLHVRHVTVSWIPNENMLEPSKLAFGITVAMTCIFLVGVLIAVRTDTYQPGSKVRLRSDYADYVGKAASGGQQTPIAVSMKTFITDSIPVQFSRKPWLQRLHFELSRHHDFYYYLCDRTSGRGRTVRSAEGSNSESHAIVRWLSLISRILPLLLVNTLVNSYLPSESFSTCPEQRGTKLYSENCSLERGWIVLFVKLGAMAWCASCFQCVFRWFNTVISLTFDMNFSLSSSGVFSRNIDSKNASVGVNGNGFTGISDVISMQNYRGTMLRAAATTVYQDLADSELTTEFTAVKIALSRQQSSQSVETIKIKSGVSLDSLKEIRTDTEQTIQFLSVVPRRKDGEYGDSRPYCQELYIWQRFIAELLQSSLRRYYEYYSLPVKPGALVGWLQTTAHASIFAATYFTLLFTCFAIILYATSKMTHDAAVQWLVQGTILIFADIFVISPVSILIIHVIIPGYLGPLVLFAMLQVYQQKNLMMLRSSGFMNTSVMHFTWPVLRVCRRLPKLSLSRLLMSVTEFDIIYMREQIQRQTHFLTTGRPTTATVIASEVSPAAGLENGSGSIVLRFLLNSTVSIHIPLLIQSLETVPISFCYVYLLAATLVSVHSSPAYSVLVVVVTLCMSFLLVRYYCVGTASRVGGYAAIFEDLEDADMDTLWNTSADGMESKPQTSFSGDNKRLTTIKKLKKYLTRRKVKVFPVALTVATSAHYKEEIHERMDDFDVSESKKPIDYLTPALRMKPTKMRKRRHRKCNQNGPSFDDETDFSHIETIDLLDGPDNDESIDLIAKGSFFDASALFSADSQYNSGLVSGKNSGRTTTSLIIGEVSPYPAQDTESHSPIAIGGHAGKIYLPRISTTRNSPQLMRIQRLRTDSPGNDNCSIPRTLSMTAMAAIAASQPQRGNTASSVQQDLKASGPAVVSRRTRARRRNRSLDDGHQRSMEAEIMDDDFDAFDLLSDVHAADFSVPIRVPQSPLSALKSTFSANRGLQRSPIGNIVNKPTAALFSTPKRLADIRRHVYHPSEPSSPTNPSSMILTSAVATLATPPVSLQAVNGISASPSKPTAKQSGI